MADIEVEDAADQVIRLMEAAVGRISGEKIIGMDAMTNGTKEEHGVDEGDEEDPVNHTDMEGEEDDGGDDDFRDSEEEDIAPEEDDGDVGAPMDPDAPQSSGDISVPRMVQIALQKLGRGTLAEIHDFIKRSWKQAARKKNLKGQISRTLSLRNKYYKKSPSGNARVSIWVLHGAPEVQPKVEDAMPADTNGDISAISRDEGAKSEVVENGSENGKHGDNSAEEDDGTNRGEVDDSGEGGSDPSGAAPEMTIPDMVKVALDVLGTGTLHEIHEYIMSNHKDIVERKNIPNLKVQISGALSRGKRFLKAGVSPTGLVIWRLATKDDKPNKKKRKLETKKSSPMPPRKRVATNHKVQNGSSNSKPQNGTTSRPSTSSSSNPDLPPLRTYVVEALNALGREAILPEIVSYIERNHADVLEKRQIKKLGGRVISILCSNKGFAKKPSTRPGTKYVWVLEDENATKYQVPRRRDSGRRSKAHARSDDEETSEEDGQDDFMDEDDDDDDDSEEGTLSNALFIKMITLKTLVYFNRKATAEEIVSYIYDHHGRALHKRDMKDVEQLLKMVQSAMSGYQEIVEDLKPQESLDDMAVELKELIIEALAQLHSATAEQIGEWILTHRREKLRVPAKKLQRAIRVTLLMKSNTKIFEKHAIIYYIQSREEMEVEPVEIEADARVKLRSKSTDLLSWAIRTSILQSGRYIVLAISQAIAGFF